MSEQPKQDGPIDFDALMKEVDAARKESPVFDTSDVPPGVPVVDARKLQPHERTMLMQAVYVMQAMLLQPTELIDALRKIATLFEQAKEEADKRDKK